MAIAVDQPTIGDAIDDTSGTTMAFTTSATVASSGFIVVGVHWYSSSVTLSSVSGGGLSWTVDKQGRANTFHNSALASAQAPSGLASGTTITATFSATTGGRGIDGTSFTGVATSSPVDTTSGPTGWTSNTLWSSASTSIAAGSVLCAKCVQFLTGGTTNTPTSPSVETHDYNDPAGQSGTFCYRIESGAGSYTVAGTWSSVCEGVVNTAAYLEAGAAAAQPVMARAFNPIPFLN